MSEDAQGRISQTSRTEGRAPKTLVESRRVATVGKFPALDDGGMREAGGTDVDVAGVHTMGVAVEALENRNQPGRDGSVPSARHPQRDHVPSYMRPGNETSKCGDRRAAFC